MKTIIKMVIDQGSSYVRGTKVNELNLSVKGGSKL